MIPNQREATLRRQGEEGLTLVELMITAVIVAVGMTIILGGLVAIINHQRITSIRYQAYTYMNSQLEHLHDVHVSDWLTFDLSTSLVGGAPFGSTVTLYAIDSSDNPVQIPMADPTTFGPVPDPIELELVVLVPTTPGSASNYRFQTSDLYIYE